MEFTLTSRLASITIIDCKFSFNVHSKSIGLITITLRKDYNDYNYKYNYNYYIGHKHYKITTLQHKHYKTLAVFTSIDYIGYSYFGNDYMNITSSGAPEQVSGLYAVDKRLPRPMLRLPFFLWRSCTITIYTRTSYEHILAPHTNMPNKMQYKN